MNNEDLQQISNILDQKLDPIIQGQAKLEQGQAKLEQGQAKLEQGQAKLEQKVDSLDKKTSRIFDNLADFREEVKQGQDYTHRVINDGFEKIAQQMTQLFAHEKRITSLEHSMTKMSVLAPEHFKMKVVK